MRRLNLLIVHGLAFGVAVLVSTACPAPDYPATAFRCDPTGGAEDCPEGYICCSDDPAAMIVDEEDLAAASAFTTPNYQGRDGGSGIPLFSANNNSLSITGMCIAEGAVPLTDGLVEQPGCPVPCNPTWDPDDIDAICGTSAICCQTVEIEAQDCVIDEATDCWRPVDGNDIFAGLTQWRGTEHATHQDPVGKNCKAFVAGAAMSLGLDADAIEALENACFTKLTVADQRGFCLGITPTVTACPLTQPGYIDACEQRNLEEGKQGC